MTDDVQETLDALAARLQRSLTIDSVDGDLLAYSAQHDDADRARVATILQRQVAAEVRAWEHRHVGDDPTGPVLIPANAELGMSARLCVPLRADDRVVGYLYLVQPDPALTAAEHDALLRGARVLAAGLEVQHDRVVGAHASRREIDRLLRELFENERADAFSRLASATPSLVEGAVRAVAAVASGRDRVRPLSTSEFTALSGSVGPVLRSHPLVVGSYTTTTYVVAVVHERTRGELDAVVTDLDRLVERCLAGADGHRIGVSGAARLQARSARDLRRQALTAAELAVLDPALGPCRHYPDLGPYRALVAGRTAADDSLTALDESGASGPMLLQTLETYLDLGGDVQRTATRLSLHRSSLYYRLNRIDQLLGVDLADGMIRLALHIELKNRRLRRRTLES